MKGCSKNTYRVPFGIILFMLLFTSAIGLSGCSENKTGTNHTGMHHDLDRMKEMPPLSFLGAEIVPIQVNGGEFYKAAGWLDENNIIYIVNEGNGSSLYSYQLDAGLKSKLFSSEIPITTAELNPDKELILIHSATSNEGTITVIDSSGQVLFSTSIESYELSFEWNPFAEHLVLLTAFNEEWNFNTYLLDVKKKNMEEYELPQPFARWISKDELVFQEWDEEGISLQAPLRVISLKDQNTKEALSLVHRFDSLGRNLLSVKIDESDPDRAYYEIHSNRFERIAGFAVPILTSYSGWLIPFYDLMDGGREFVYLRATHMGEADVYQDGFDLIRFNLESGKEELIFTGLANEPLACSPSGTRCLYGFQLEKIINLETKEIIELAQ
ncbi:MAG TPA: hypothetical protein DCR24_01650 [Bacillus bacterium]|nr:hypothetical protein [Bacillus sp. (in: firmicutes)]